MELTYLLIILLINIAVCSKIITIPFKIEFKKSSYIGYNSFSFLNENYKKDLIIELNIGTPPQKVTTYLNQSSCCFQLISLNKINKTSDSNNNFFIPGKSSTFEISSKKNILSELYSAHDFFNFNFNQNYKLNIELAEDINKESNSSIISLIGVKPVTPFLNICPNLFDNLKNRNLIDKKIFSIRYNNKYHGDIIIGNDLSIFAPNNFKEDNFQTSYFFSDFNFKYDLINLKYPWNKTEYFFPDDNKGKKEAIINLNSGFIIGTDEFRNFLHDKVFRFLISKRICELNIIRANDIDKLFDNDEFYLYNCYHMQFTGKDDPNHPSTNYYKEFPNIILTSKTLGINFEFTNDDLFEQIYSRDYFLIIFPKPSDNQKYINTWFLGEPFYKKYPFTINYDAKTIGFYSDIIINIKNNNTNNSNNEENINVNITKENNINNENKSQMTMVVIKFLEIIAVLGFIIGAYYIGVKVNERRKKRANELKDDFYVYIPEEKKDINNNDNESKTKNQKLVELNSKLGV